PADAAVVGAPPTLFSLTLSAAVDPSTVDPSDLMVDGKPADSVTVTDPTTLTFTYSASPVAAQGPQVIQVAEGAFADLAKGPAVNAFSSTFYYDVLPMQATSPAPAAGSLVTLPFTTLDLNFNEPYGLASASPGDFTLNQGGVTAVSQVD